MQKKLQRLAEAVRVHAVSEGYCQTTVPYLSAYRCTGQTVTMPETAAPYLYLLAAGSIRLHTPSGILDYVPGQYSISAIDTPGFGCALSCSERNDLLALVVEFTLDEVISVILDMDGDLPERIIGERLSGQAAEAADAAVVDAAIRLALMLDERASVTDASLEVGYESVSQFIRDYKKMFLAPPGEDIQSIRRQLNAGTSLGKTE